MKISTCNANPNPFPHGIDITAPGGIDQLIGFHRSAFGNWQMNANGDGEGGGDGGDGAEGSGGADGDGTDGTDDGAGNGDKGLKSALDAERAASKKATAELKAAQARVKELEDASKSEEQRQQEATEAERTENATTKSQLATANTLLEKYEVAAAKGLDLQAAKRLQGTTREEIEKDAADWIALWGTGGGQQQEQHRGDPGQGARGAASESSYAQGADRAKARYGGEEK